MQCTPFVLMSRHFLVQQQKRIPVESLFILFVTTLWPTHSHTDLVDIAQALLETARDWTVQYSIWIKKMIMELKQTITPQISIAILIDQTIVFRSSQTGVSFVHLDHGWTVRKPAMVNPLLSNIKSRGTTSGQLRFHRRYTFFCDLYKSMLH